MVVRPDAGLASMLASNPARGGSTELLSMSMASQPLLLPCRLLSEQRAWPRSWGAARFVGADRSEGADSGPSSSRMEAANFSRSSSL